MPDGKQPTARSRLTPQRERELFTATLDLLQEVGYDALTMDTVAARAQASKATLYRRWSGKARLVVAALQHHKPLSFSDIDTGSLRADLIETARRVGRVAPADSALMSGLAHAVHNHPELAQAQRDVLMQPETDAINAMLRRAVERGELTGGEAAIEFGPLLFVSAVLARPLIEGEHADEDYLVRLVDSVVLPALHGS